MAVTIYHNPDCGTSRNALALIRKAGIEPVVVEYLKTPPARDELRALIERAGLSVRDVLRRKGTPYAALGLDDPALGGDVLLDAMMAHPILINRPLVASDDGAALCRPSDVVLDLLPAPPREDVFKEEGVPFLRDRSVPGASLILKAALEAANLPAADLEDPGRTFFAYHGLGGTLMGFGGYELYGADALIRSIVVPERGKGIGRNLVPLLTYRAFREGARRAWLLTMNAAGFFAKIGFKEAARQDAPAAILATRQARDMCPASATLMGRAIGF